MQINRKKTKDSGSVSRLLAFRLADLVVSGAKRFYIAVRVLTLDLRIGQLVSNKAVAIQLVCQQLDSGFPA